MKKGNEKTRPWNCRFHDGFTSFFSFFTGLASGNGRSKKPELYNAYTQADPVYMGILKNVCAQHSMREMEENFNKETCIDTLRILSGNQKLEEMPHYDTLNYYLERLSPECLSGVRKKMPKS